MYRNPSQFIVIDGHELPCPAPDLEIISTQAVNQGRNVNAETVFDLVGRRMWKINNLHWNGLNADQWAYIKSLLKPFKVKVTFTGDDNQRHTVTMYPGDTNAKPLFLNSDKMTYQNYETCKFNLIDCGYADED